MKKKQAAALVTAAVMALSLTACGGTAKEASGDKESGLSGEITIWSWDVALDSLAFRLRQRQKHGLLQISQNA